MTPKSISVPGPDRIGYQSVGYWYPDGPDTGCPVSQYTPDSHRTGYAKTSQIEIVPPAGPDTDSARGESAPAGPDGPDVRMSGTMVLVLLVMSFFINPIGASDQAWGTIATSVRVLVQGP